MDLDDIARLWKVTRSHAQRYLVKRPEFPEPAPGSTRKNPRWRSSDVAAFIQGPATEDESRRTVARPRGR